MAHFAVRHLFDDISEKYLISKGWVLVADTKYSKWILGGAASLYLSETDVVSTDEVLIATVTQQYYTRGREKGKQDALEIIGQKLSDVVFPKVKNVDQSYS